MNCSNFQSSQNLNPMYLVLIDQTSTKQTLSCPLVPHREEFAITVVQAISS